MHRTNLLEKTLMLWQIEGRMRSGQQIMKWLDGITDSTDMNLSKLLEMVKDIKVWRCAVHGITKSQTQFSNWTTESTGVRTWVRFHIQGSRHIGVALNVVGHSWSGWLPQMPRGTGHPEMHTHPPTKMLPPQHRLWALTSAASPSAQVLLKRAVAGFPVGIHWTPPWKKT